MGSMAKRVTFSMFGFVKKDTEPTLKHVYDEVSSHFISRIQQDLNDMKQ